MIERQQCHAMVGGKEGEAFFITVTLLRLFQQLNADLDILSLDSNCFVRDKRSTNQAQLSLKNGAVEKISTLDLLNFYK